MTLRLPPEEPSFGPWEVRPIPAFVQSIRAEFPKNMEGPGIVAIDGRSAGGKTTLATLVSQAIPNATVVHTDDIAWHHSFFDWTDLLLSAVLEPVRAGRSVAYRPSAWEERGREGTIEVPLGCSMVILEGVGAGRRELMHAVDAVIWVQSDLEKTKLRGLARDIAETGDAAAATVFWDEWMSAELIFQAEQRPWERADFVVSGTPDLEHNPASEVVVTQKPPRSSIKAITSS